MGDVTESDPFSISWKDEDDALEEFCLLIKKRDISLLGPLFKVGKSAVFKAEDI